jgi:prepilin-type N-terminal cleavage/methylation domain-containing protein
MKSVPSGSRGMTLIELLAALLISGFVVSMAGRIFLSGNAQFVKRSADSERLSTLYGLKAALRGALRGEVSRCAGGTLWLKDKSVEIDLLTLLRKKTPELADGKFRCLEPDAAGTALQDWREAIQPPLVEYRLLLKLKGEADSLSGSWLR